MAELIISDVRPRVQYVADGVQTVFPYPFPIIDQADLVVVFDDNEAAGANSVTGVGASSGGDVIFELPPPADTRVTIYRDMAFARETDFQEAGDFRAAVINEELDRMAMLLQQAEMLVADSLHKPLYDLEATLTLPSASDRAGRVLAFDETGLPTVGSASSEAASLAAGSASEAAASADSALASLAAIQQQVNYAINTAVPVQSLSGDGATTVFLLDRSVLDSTSVAVTIDGIKQHTNSYAASGMTLTFSGAPPPGSGNIEVTFIGFVGLISDIAEIPDDGLSGAMISGGTMDGVSVDGLNGGPLAGFRNRIMNGDFRIAQRGTSFPTPPTDPSETLDRWGTGYLSPSGIALTISREAFAPGQTDVPGEPEFHYRWNQTTAGTATELFLFQRIEDVRTLAAQTCTLSFWARADAPRTVTPRWRQDFGSGGSGDVTATLPACNLTSGWQKFTRSFAPAGIAGKTLGAGHFLAIELMLPTGTTMTVDLAQVQLEPGSVATPFEWRPAPVELAMCQRYYARLSNAASAWAISATDVATMVLFPVPMRAVPTVFLLDTTPNFNDFNVGGTSGGSSVTAIYGFTEKGGIMRLDGFSTLVTSRPGMWNQTSPIWSFDAEL
ncbi:MAG: hypothetical protein WD767_20075 [Alphaproteobacteria bacterium]